MLDIISDDDDVSDWLAGSQAGRQAGRQGREAEKTCLYFRGQAGLAGRGHQPKVICLWIISSCISKMATFLFALLEMDVSTHK